MKKYLFLGLAMIAGMFMFTSCGDDEVEPNDDNWENAKVESAKFTETDNQMVLTWTTKAGSFSVASKLTVDFVNDVCSRFVTEATYPSEAYAKLAYEEAKAAQDSHDTAVYSYKGKVFIEDDTEEYKGTPKAEMRQILKEMENIKGKY